MACEIQTAVQGFACNQAYPHASIAHASTHAHTFSHNHTSTHAHTFAHDHTSTHDHVSANSTLLYTSAAHFYALLAFVSAFHVHPLPKRLPFTFVFRDNTVESIITHYAYKPTFTHPYPLLGHTNATWSSLSEANPSLSQGHDTHTHTSLVNIHTAHTHSLLARIHTHPTHVNTTHIRVEGNHTQASFPSTLMPPHSSSFCLLPILLLLLLLLVTATSCRVSSRGFLPCQRYPGHWQGRKGQKTEGSEEEPGCTRDEVKYKTEPRESNRREESECGDEKWKCQKSEEYPREASAEAREEDLRKENESITGDKEGQNRVRKVLHEGSKRDVTEEKECLHQANQTLQETTAEGKGAVNPTTQGHGGVGTTTQGGGGVRAAPGEWVRPLSNLGEVISAVGLLCGTFNMAQVLWLASPTPVTPALVRHALTLVARRVVVLQLCLEWRGLWPWYRRMRRVVVDVSMARDDDPLAVCYRQVRSGYCATRGPLWRATLVPLPQSGPDRHHAALVLTIHHAITDGTTNMVISRDFLQTLNSIMTGRQQETPIRDLVPLLSQQATGRRDWLHTLKFILSATRTALANAFNSKSLLRHLPRPRTTLALTKILRHDFSADTTEKLLKCCKETGVRVDSCVMAIANLALFRTVQKYSPEEINSIKIVHERAVNIRRYYDSKHQKSVGSAAFLSVHDHVVSNLDSDKFWSLAGRMQDELYRSLQVERTPLRTSSLGWLCAGLIPLNFVLSKLGWTNFTFSHINSTNMGNLQRLLPARYDGGPVEVTGLLRTTAAELAGSIFTVTCQTLDHRLLTSLDYYTNRVTEEVARDFFLEFARCVTEVAQYGTLIAR